LFAFMSPGHPRSWFPAVSRFRGLLVLRLWLALSLSLGMGATLAQSVAIAETPLSPAAIVMGMLGYTSWPGPARTLKLCVSRGAPDAAALAGAIEQARATRALELAIIEVDQVPASACDLVYFDGWDAELQRKALRALAARPVLSIGWGAEFCSDGGLFCLERGEAQTRFEVNLDAVARSGLRVNALVLRLAKPRKVAGS